MCFYTKFSKLHSDVEKKGMAEGQEGDAGSLRAWKCVSPHAIDIYYNPNIILFIRFWTACAAK